MSSAKPTQPPTPAASPVPTPGGLVVAPFRALRFHDVDRLEALTSPPYDVIDADGVTALEARDPHNVVRLILPRDVTDEPGSRYAAAARTLAAWRQEQVLDQDVEPGLYVYEQSSPGHTQRGVIAAVGLVALDAGIILPHENTMAGPVADRLALSQATEADLEPIFLVYDGAGGAGAAVLEAATTAAPLLELRTSDGLRHRLWALTDAADQSALAGDLFGRIATIADGHHRYANYRQRQAESHAAGAGTGPWDYGMAFLVDTSASGPEVHPIHRNVPGLAFADALRAASGAFDVQEVDAEIPGLLAKLAAAGAEGPAFAITDGQAAVVLTHPSAETLGAIPADRSDAWRELDVTLAHLGLIQHVWGLDDREGVVDYHHDAADTIAAARATGGTALLLNPTPVSAVAEVAAAGDRMPRKSTLFTPKPLTGLVIRPLDGGPTGTS
jgi:uncharacterized protein (DUF1015 family)